MKKKICLKKTDKSSYSFNSFFIFFQSGQYLSINFLNSFGLTRKFYKGIDIVEKLTNNGKSVVAWGCFVNTLKYIQDELSKRGIKSIVISGSMPLEEREDNIKKQQETIDEQQETINEQQEEIKQLKDKGDCVIL